jgi:protein gp37
MNINLGTGDNKEYVSFYVTPEIAKQLQNLVTSGNERAMVEEVALKLKLDIERELSQLDDDLARYKAACVVFKSSLKDVYGQQQEEIEKVINDLWDIMPKVKQETQNMLSKIKQELSPLKEQLSEIKQLTNNIDIYGAERVLELAKTVSNLDTQSKEILSFLMDNYKR